MATDAVNVIANFRLRVVPERHALVKKALVIAIYDGVTIASPVDEGRFRASWNLAVGSPDLSVVPETRGGKLLGRRGQRRGTIPANPAPNVPTVAAGVWYWVTNNLSYALRLNAGWSTQAPAGFVQKVVGDMQAKWTQIVRSVVPRP